MEFTPNIHKLITVIKQAVMWKLSGLLFLDWKTKKKAENGTEEKEKTLGLLNVSVLQGTF